MLYGNHRPAKIMKHNVQNIRFAAPSQIVSIDPNRHSTIRADPLELLNILNKILGPKSHRKSQSAKTRVVHHQTTFVVTCDCELSHFNLTYSGYRFLNLLWCVIAIWSHRNLGPVFLKSGLLLTAIYDMWDQWHLATWHFPIHWECMPRHSSFHWYKSNIKFDLL